MHKTCFLLSLTGAALLCGCDRQIKINSEKIQVLSQNIVQFEQSQAKQMTAIQAQLTSLAPMLDRMNNSYFEKNRDYELLYHTNTLYLLLMVDKKIEAHLQVADTEREAESSLAYSYHTNEMDLLQSCAAQIQDAITSQESRMRDAMAGQESRVEDKVNAETRRVGANLSDELLKQIKLSAPDAVETARRSQMAADVAQMKQALDQIKVQLGQMTNPPAARP
jgi:hypothetical protein